MFDPVPLLQAILVGATVAGAVTLSAVVVGVVTIAARGGVHHIEDFPRPGVSARAEEVQVRLRRRYLLRQNVPDARQPRLRPTGNPEVMPPPVQPEPRAERPRTMQTPPAVIAMVPAAAVVDPSPIAHRRGRHALVSPLAPAASTGGFTATLSRRQRTAVAGEDRRTPRPRDRRERRKAPAPPTP